MEDQIKCELIGKGSPRHLVTFTDFKKIFLLAVHYPTTHINTRYVTKLIREISNFWTKLDQTFRDCWVDAGKASSPWSNKNRPISWERRGGERHFH